MTHTKSPYLPVFGDLHRELNRIFENMSDTSETSPATWTPRMDTVEFDDRFEIRMDLPGVEKEALAISFEGDTLEISGERKPGEKSETRAYSRCECAWGPFSRKLRFPSLVSAAGIGAKLENGVLVVTVPKAEDAKPRSIEIA